MCYKTAYHGETEQYSVTLFYQDNTIQVDRYPPTPDRNRPWRSTSTAILERRELIVRKEKQYESRRNIRLQELSPVRNTRVVAIYSHTLNPNTRGGSYI